MSIGWGIVGPGGHAGRCMAPAVVRARGAELAAVCGRDEGRAAVFAARHGARRTYTDFGAMLRDDRVEVVYVCTPNSLRAEQTVAAAAARRCGSGDEKRRGWKPLPGHR